MNLKAVMQEMVSEQTFKRWPVDSQKRGLFLLLKAMQNAHVSRGKEPLTEERTDSVHMLKKHHKSPTQR